MKTKVRNKKLCKICNHPKDKHVEGVGCKGAFTEKELKTLDAESLFYGECMCRHFE